ncbi:MAG: c-type cytochrome, partial [Bradymonadaceae bacterium]
MNDATTKLTLAAGLAAGGLFAFSPTAVAQGIGVDEFERMQVKTDRKIERGAEIYDNQCAGCHGPKGKGDAEYPTERFGHKAPDFTAGQFRHGGGLIQIYNVITKGLSTGTTASDGQQTGAGSDSHPGGGNQPADGEQGGGQPSAASATSPYHPKYTGTLRYQERWAVAHYIRSLAEEPSKLPEDPPEVVDQARLEAKRGTCDPEVRSTVSKRVEPTGQKQLEQGKKLFKSQCASCHGETGKGDGPAGKALKPSPRNF